MSGEANGFQRGQADAISFGRPFISNPDLPQRFVAGLALAPDDIDAWYSGGAIGYADYPTAT
jgi:2,4-dienoyl-CoA reductase-like NADH-dependent reductase (Old Yellow Enzyme family)